MKLQVIAFMLLVAGFELSAVANQHIDINISEFTSYASQQLTSHPSEYSGTSGGGVNKEVLIYARNHARNYLQTNRMTPFLKSVVEQLKTSKELSDKSTEELIDALAELK